jgi:hypothetical protein
MISRGVLASQISRGRAVAARVAHNHKVAGSSPAPATMTRVLVYLGLFSLSELGSKLMRDSHRFGR